MVCTYCLLLKNKKNFVLFIFVIVERSSVRSSHIVDLVVRSEETSAIMQGRSQSVEFVVKPFTVILFVSVTAYDNEYAVRMYI